MQPSLSHLETTARTPDKMKAHSRLVEHSYLSSAETQTTAPIRRDYDTRKASRPVCLAYYPARASKLVPKRQQMHESRRRQPMSCPLRSPSIVWPRSNPRRNGRLPHLPLLPRRQLDRSGTLLRRPREEIERPRLRKR